MAARKSTYIRMVKRLGAAALLPLALGAAAPAQPGASCRATAAQAAETYNYTLGTQAIGGGYQFSKDTALKEQAREIRGLGSNLLKISLAPGAAQKYGFGPAANGATTTLQYVKAAPGVQQVLDMDFSHYQLWVHSFTGSQWRDGVSQAEARRYYDEMYQLASWILTRYSGSGKVFMVGNWEGDWLLHGRQGRDGTPPPQAIQGMIDWLNIRQKAIDDAKAAVRHNKVELYHYVEVNLVKKAMQGKPSIALSVLPATNVDLVSYSSYEAIKKSQQPDIESIRQPLTQIFRFLEGQLKPKAGLPFDRRVFIGEYGYHANKAKPLTVEQQYLKSRYVMQVSIELDLPFALIWQLYNNEYTEDGTSKEMSLIDESGQRRELYYLHQTFLREMKLFVIDSCQKTGHVPTRAEFKARALELLPTLSFEKMRRDHAAGPVDGPGGRATSLPVS
ncbi:MAG: hypothetical protein GXC70_00210 [Sphingomonadaceae bacterium]|nr:hypothetical protein [Sphingomonadaceae bacterium]